MDISHKHLKMIEFALERWIEDLFDRTEDLPAEFEELHHREMEEFVKLHEMIQQLILRQ